jgi:hypothetical protein
MMGMKKNKVNFLIINQVQRYQMDKNFYHKVSGFDLNLYIKVEGEWVMEWKGLTQNGDKV